MLSRSRMESVTRDGDTVTVTLTDGRTVEGSHCILALGSVPNTADLGLEEAGVAARRRRLRHRRPGLAHLGPRGVRRRRLHRRADARLAWRRCRAGSRCGTSSATPSRRWTSSTVSSNVFTAPEIATVGWSQEAVDAGEIEAEVVTLPLAGNAARQDAGRPRRLREALLPARHRHRRRAAWSSAPRASELIHPVSIAVAESLTADQLAQAFTVYPSMSGSVAEAARRLHRV